MSRRCGCLLLPWCFLRDVSCPLTYTTRIRPSGIRISSLDRAHTRGTIQPAKDGENESSFASKGVIDGRPKWQAIHLLQATCRPPTRSAIDHMLMVITPCVDQSELPTTISERQRDRDTPLRVLPAPFSGLRDLRQILRRMVTAHRPESRLPLPGSPHSLEDFLNVVRPASELLLP
jgi:hypothetical protein